MDIGSTSATLNALTDWTESLDEAVANGLKIIRYTGAGVPSNPTFVTTAATRSASIAYRISGADKTVAPQIGTTATGTSATPNPPSVTPTGGVSKDYLSIPFYGAAGEEADDDTWSDTPPSGWGPTPPRQKACGIAGSNLGGLIAAAELAITTGAAIDPGTFAKDVSVAWRAQHVLIHPLLVQDLAIPFTDFTEQLFAPSLANQSPLDLAVGFLASGAALFLPTLAIPLGQLKDNFNDNSLDTNLWEIIAGTVSENGERLELNNATTYAVVHSRNFVDATESEILGEWTMYTGTGTGSAQSGFKLFRGAGATYGHLQIMRHNVGSIQISKTEDNVSIFAESITYSATDHKWLRIRTTATQSIFEASADGITWTQPWTNSVSALPTWSLDDGVLVELFAGYFNAGQPDPGTTFVDNFNRPPQALNVGFLASGSQLFAPSFVKDVEIGFISSTAQLFAPTLENEAGGDQNLEIPFHEQVTGFFAMSLANQSPNELEVPLLASGTQLFAPTLETQTPLSVSPGFITSTVQLFAPELVSEQSVEVGFIAPTTQLFNPALVNQSSQSVSPGFIPSGSQIFAPSVSLQINHELEIPLLTLTTTFFQPSLVIEGEDLFEAILAGNGSLIDQVMNGLITQGFLAGTVTDRERDRLLNKLALVAPQNLSMMDLYTLAGESNRLYEIGIDEL
jgi:hypothetical protein